MGVIIRRWLWLECIGVVSGWFCKEVYNYTDFLIHVLLILSLLHLY